MTRDPIFKTLRPEALSEIAKYLAWDPLVCNNPAKLLSACSTDQRLPWLAEHRTQLEDHISWVGTPIFSFAFGNARSYREIVLDFASQLKIDSQTQAETATVEASILHKIWSDALSRLTPEEREALLSKARALAEQYSPHIGKEMAGFASLTAAQLSGFGIYLLGSTLLGALNSVLGLGLGFGAFTGLSSLISVAIGPWGWAALGLYTIKKLGGTNYRKLLPVIVLIAMERAGGENFSRLVQEHRNSELSAMQQVALAPPGPPVSEVSGSAAADTRPPVRRAEERRQPKPTLHVYSRAEKTHFQLRPENRELCSLTAEFCPGRHFLDLSTDEQQFIRDYLNVVGEERKEAAEVAEVAAKEKRKQRKREEREERALKKQNRKFDAKIQKRGKEYSKLLRNLEFHPDALERLELAAQSGGSSQIDEALGLMNVGHTVYRDSIDGTQPKIYEAKAGWDYRIYFCRVNQRTFVRLIGDKGTQSADVEQLRSNPLGSLKCERAKAVHGTA